MTEPLAGADGGRQGAWVVVRGHRQGSTWGPLEGYIADRFEQVWHPQDRPVSALVAVDIPIGLPDQPARGGRTAEREARARLGRRASSVFSTPCRAAVALAAARAFAPDCYPEVSALNAAASPHDIRVSKQAFFIIPRIHEVDAWLRRNQRALPKTFEVHPELAFRALAGPLPPKKTLRGKLARIGALEKAGMDVEAVLALEEDPRASGDDILDACVCLWSAGRIDSGRAESLPSDIPTDAEGLPMAIWF